MLISQICFDSQLLITFLAGLFLRAVGWKPIILFGRFIDRIDTYLYAKFKNNLSEETCKTDKPLSLSIKILKNMAHGKDGKWNTFFRFEIVPTNINSSQILKNIRQQLLSLNNILKGHSFHTGAVVFATKAKVPNHLSKLKLLGRWSNVACKENI